MKRKKDPCCAVLLHFCHTLSTSAVLCPTPFCAARRIIFWEGGRVQCHLDQATERSAWKDLDKFNSDAKHISEIDSAVDVGEISPLRPLLWASVEMTKGLAPQSLCVRYYDFARLLAGNVMELCSRAHAVLLPRLHGFGWRAFFHAPLVL